MELKQILSLGLIVALLIILSSSSVFGQEQRDAQTVTRSNLPNLGPVQLAELIRGPGPASKPEDYVTTLGRMARKLIYATKNLALGESDGKNELSGILDTFSLSFVGNFNFANAIDGIKKIIEGVASCKNAQ